MLLKQNIGEDAIVNPKSLWDLEKEKIYQKQLKEFWENDKNRIKKNEKVERDGFFISKCIIFKNGLKCPKCNNGLLNFRDELYINKYNNCFLCYIINVEGKETRKE